MGVFQGDLLSIAIICGLMTILGKDIATCMGDWVSVFNFASDTLLGMK